MKPETYEILNDPELIAIRDDYFRRMQDVYDGTNDGQPAFVLSGLTPPCEVPEGATLEETMHLEFDAMATEAHLMRDPRIFRPVASGASSHGLSWDDDFFPLPKEPDPVTKFRRIKLPVGSLDPPDLNKSEAWRNMKRSAEIFLEADVKLPLFSAYGVTGPIVEAVSLYGGEKFLLGLLDDPDAARSDLQVLADLAAGMRKWFVDNIPEQQLQGIIHRLRGQPPGYGQIDGCTLQLIGPDIYREIVGPLDNAILGVFPKGGMIHICGYHTHHIPFWREMENLKVLQLSGDAMTDLEIYHKELRDDQLVFVSPHATMLLPQIMEITQGRRVIIALYPKDLDKIETEIDAYGLVGA
ncbi:MAG: uroporphyrinogen decarboxylase/cobalamine-independent methonine synthase family protein [Planctomycetota bacterium]|jgi:hypothetical protein